jgi:hypothetical protein
MHTLPYQYNTDLFPHLTVWFRYRSSKYDGFKRLREFWNGNADPHSSNDFNSEQDYHPLTEAEEQRWRVLERKAKQENLSGHDSAEYDILLEVKLYHRYKAECPHLGHESLLKIVRERL